MYSIMGKAVERGFLAKQMARLPAMPVKSQILADWCRIAALLAPRTT